MQPADDRPCRSGRLSARGRHWTRRRPFGYVATVGEARHRDELLARRRQRFITRTPCVARPIVEMPDTGQRSTLPPSVISMTSSSSTTWATPTTWPLRSLVRIVMTPEPPRRLEPVILERRALAVAALGDGEDRRARREDLHPDHLVVRPASEMPRTPVAVRPIARTSLSGKRIDLPPLRRDDDLPGRRWVRQAAISSSPSARLMAMIPPRRGFEYARRALVFLMTPLRVQSSHEVVIGLVEAGAPATWPGRARPRRAAAR